MSAVNYEEGASIWSLILSNPYGGIVKLGVRILQISGIFETISKVFSDRSVFEYLRLRIFYSVGSRWTSDCSVTGTNSELT